MVGLIQVSSRSAQASTVAAKSSFTPTRQFIRRMRRARLREMWKSSSGKMPRCRGSIQ